MSKLRRLYKQAKEYVSDGDDDDDSEDEDLAWQPVDVFYRNKPSSYYSNIMQTGGVLPARKKDYNGSDDCPINGRIRGIFFSANNYMNSSCRASNLPGRSPFGDRRLIVPANYLGDGKRLYFADFYCSSSGRPHYVTLVMTTPYSEADDFCEDHLVRLRKADNPFLKCVNGQWKATSDAWVEIFYTNHVDVKGALRAGATFQNVYSTGTASVRGIPKDRFCSICNVSNRTKTVISSNKAKTARGLSVGKVVLGIAAVLLGLYIIWAYVI